MTPPRIELGPKVLRNLAARGEAGTVWLERLLAGVCALERDWNLTVGEIMPNATEAYVAQAVTAAGEPAVLKIPIPGVEKAQRELHVLRAADGNGFVRLLRYEMASGAMLLERLGPQLAEAGLGIQAQFEVICETLKAAWRMPPGGLP